jgi:hypothetical protein
MGAQTACVERLTHKSLSNPLHASDATCIEKTLDFFARHLRGVHVT